MAVHRTVFLLASLLFYFLHAVFVCQCWCPTAESLCPGSGSTCALVATSLSLEQSEEGADATCPVGDLTIVNALPQGLWDLSLVPSPASGRVKPAFPRSSR